MNTTEVQPTKRALLIGINTYPHLEQRYQLNGCVNDVQLMANTLQTTFGFPAETMTILQDEEATRDGILSAMTNLVDQTGPNDIVVFHYSGHGSQMTDRENDEPDGLDETIVAHDSGRGTVENRDITDDEIYTWLLRLSKATPYITLLFDCCHSGNISRDLFGDASRWVEPDTRAIKDLPPSPAGLVPDRGDGRDVGASGWLPLGDRYVLISGCQDDESSYEYTSFLGGSPVKQGALTYFLVQELVKAQSGATYRDVFERASTQVTAVRTRQHPQMEGARDRELFGVHDIAPMRFVGVQQRAGDQVTLSAGAAHGMTVGSQWDIYSQAINQVDDGTPRLGRVEIIKVRAVVSTAKVLEEGEAGTIVAGARAVEFAHFYGEMRLVVDVQAPVGYEAAVAALDAMLDDSRLLRRAAAGEPANARAYLLAPRTDAKPGDPVPQLKRIDSATWAVVGEDGLLLMPPHPVAELGVAGVVRDNLEKAVRYRQALALRNPNDASPLKDKVDLILLRQTVDGAWEEAKPETSVVGQKEVAGKIVFEEGDVVAFRLINRSTTPVYVNVLDFGLTEAISQLYPPPGAKEQLLPNTPVDIGVRGEFGDFFMPDNFPYVSDPVENQGPAGGSETFKLFATTQPTDFSMLQQDGMRDIGRRPGTPLEQLLDMALAGTGTRDVQLNRVSLDAEWTTVERSFFLRRKVL